MSDTQEDQDEIVINTPGVQFGELNLEPESESDSEVEVAEPKLVNQAKYNQIEHEPMSELDNIRRIMYKPTSGQDLEYMTDGRANIVSYEELQNYNTFDELVGEDGAAIILYPNAGTNVGHWTCVFVMPYTGAVQFFDSYGISPDEELDEYNSDPNTIHKRQRFPPKLLDLLLKSQYADSVFWNEYPMQSLDKATNTCGLWCVFRLKNRSLTENEFKKLFYDIPYNSGISPDLALSRLTSIHYPEF